MHLPVVLPCASFPAQASMLPTEASRRHPSTTSPHARLALGLLAMVDCAQGLAIANQVIGATGP
jgi:hypothetical protein